MLLLLIKYWFVPLKDAVGTHTRTNYIFTNKLTNTVIRQRVTSLERSPEAQRSTVNPENTSCPEGTVTQQSITLGTTCPPWTDRYGEAAQRKDSHLIYAINWLTALLFLVMCLSESDSSSSGATESSLLHGCCSFWFVAKNFLEKKNVSASSCTVTPGCEKCLKLKLTHRKIPVQLWGRSKLEDEMMKWLFKEAMICSTVICLFVSRSFLPLHEEEGVRGFQDEVVVGSCCLLSLRCPLHAADS